MKIYKALVVLAAALAAAGCVSTKDFQAEQDRVSELQAELASLRRTASSKSEVQSVNERIAEQTEMLLKSNATLVSKVAQIEQSMQSGQGSVEQVSYRLDQLSQQVTQAQRDIEALKAQLGGAAAPAAGQPAGGQMTVPSGGGDPMQTYQSAYRDYQKGNYDLAIEGFAEFVQASPNSDLADNAAYWIGESLFSQKKYREAIQQFDSVVSRYPKSDKVPGALLKKGYAYISVGEKAQGVVQLQYVLHEHPSSQEASLARQKLKQLGIETK